MKTIYKRWTTEGFIECDQALFELVLRCQKTLYGRNYVKTVTEGEVITKFTKVPVKAQQAALNRLK